VVFVGIYKFLIIYMLICKRYLECLLCSNKTVPVSSVPEYWSGRWWLRSTHVQTFFFTNNPKLYTIYDLNFLCILEKYVIVEVNAHKEGINIFKISFKISY